MTRFTASSVFLQEEQRTVRQRDQTSAGVASVPAAALRLLPAASLPADNSHQNAHRGEQRCMDAGGALMSKLCRFYQ